MAFLRYTQGETTFEVTIDSNDVTIGRSSECVLQIHGDSEVSRLHCSIQRRDEKSFEIIDSASRNGTYVNSSRLLAEPWELKHGDRIRVGHTKIVFYETEKAPAKTTDPDKVISEIAREMDDGKGFYTMMREIIEPATRKRSPKTIRD